MTTRGSGIELARLPREWIAPSLSLAQVLAIMNAYRAMILRIGFGTMLVAVALSFVLPKVYVATATLRIEPPARDADSGAEFSPMMAASYMATQMDLMHSTRVLTDTVEKLGWDHDPDHVQSDESPERARQRIAERVLTPNVKVVSGAKDSHLVELSYSAKTPELAAHVANVIADTYIATLNSTSTMPAEKRSKAYTEQLEKLRRDVDEAQVKVTEFRNQYGLIELDQTVDAEGKYLLDLNTRLVETESAERQGQLRLKEAHRGVAADTAVLSSPVIQTLKERLLQLETRFAEISHTLGPGHPDYRSLQAEIQVTRAKLASETGTYSQSIQGQAGITTSDAVQLRSEIARQRDKVLKVRALQEEGASLQRAFDSAKTIYDKALQDYDQVVLGSVRRLPTVNIFNEAEAPLTASRPDKKANLIIGLLGGLLCGALGCLVWELTHRRVRSPDDVELTLGLPLLAELPGSALPSPVRALSGPRLP